jgi:hypothetical protein
MSLEGREFLSRLLGAFAASEFFFFGQASDAVADCVRMRRLKPCILAAAYHLPARFLCGSLLPM